MDPINPLGSIGRLLRKRIATERGDKAGKAGTATPAKLDQAQRKSPGGTAALKQRTLEAIQAIDPQDPERDRKVIRVFVENVLVWQFGSEVMGDPGFAEWVEEVGEGLVREGVSADGLFDLGE